MCGIKFYNAYYEYCDEIDALFIHNKKDYIYDSSIELNHDIILDYDHDGIPVAIEILHTSKFFEVPKDSLKSIENLDVHLKVTEKSIDLELNFEVYCDNEKKSCSFDALKSNNVSLPNIEVKIASSNPLNKTIC